MNQDGVFWNSEGDQWYARNKAALENPEKIDWVMKILDLLQVWKKPASILDLGSSDGWRLAKIKKKYQSTGFDIHAVGIDVSEKAIEDGRKKYPLVEFARGSTASIPVNDPFDIVIVNSVLHWVDRQTLARSIAEIDRVVKDGGTLIVGDFLPDSNQKRNYHHLKEPKLYTYKQDYPKIFEALGTYKESVRLTYDCDRPEYKAEAAPSSSRAVCAALVKSIQGYYQEV